MTIHITIQHHSNVSDLPSDDELEDYIKSAFNDHVDNAEITLRIVDEEEISDLNKNYRNKTGPTNVLSFNYDLPEAVQEDVPMQGDIVICAPILKKEAAEQDKQLSAHWAHLVIHGALHLLGYEHDDDANAAKMEAIEIDILNKHGFPNPYLLEEN